MKTHYTIIHARSDRRNKYANTIVQLHKVKLLRYNPLYKGMEHYGAIQRMRVPAVLGVYNFGEEGKINGYFYATIPDNKRTYLWGETLAGEDFNEH